VMPAVAAVRTERFMDPLLGAPEGFDATLMRANDLAFSLKEYIFLNRDYT
jgi:hypothetical protein